MGEKPRRGRRREAANPAEIRGDIDAGRTGDKVPGVDPAAAPLGTDEEAAGPMFSARGQTEAPREARDAKPQDRRPHAATPELAPDARLPPQRVGPPLALILGVIAALILALVFYLLL